MLRFAVKAGLASTAVYYISELGVWKDSQTTAKLHQCIKKHTTPYIQQATAQLPFELPSLPKADSVSQLGKAYWNCGVKTTFSFILNIPTHMSDLSKSIGEKFDEFANAPSIPSPSDSK